MWDLARPHLPEPDADPADLTMLKKLDRLAQMYSSWQSTSQSIETYQQSATPNDTESRAGRYAFLFERMHGIRSIMLQAGFDLDNIPRFIEQVEEDYAALHELQATLEELSWQCRSFADEIDRRVQHLPEDTDDILSQFMGTLRKA